MEPNARLSTAAEIMIEFARSTGLSPAAKTPRRYLWTDAFAVCNFLELYRQTGDEQYKDLALVLVDQVHDILGRHREDDARTGWISGMDEKEGRNHPTRGGVRIGKKMNESGPADRFDEDLEWDRDGQYYHYLTKWMHALSRVGRVTGDSSYNRWATELAKTAHARFTHLPSPGSQKRMYWKMSIDLSHPLVPSMGHHDPLDGFITYNELQAALVNDLRGSPDLDLSDEITDMAAICHGKNWATEDPLGIGGLFGVLFGVVVLLNLLRSRFWCKYICPLGALLGVVGKNPVLRLEVDPARCNDCKICLTECQGGADPNSQASQWKPSECMYCLNCQSGCPSEAMRFRFTIPGSAIGATGKQPLTKIAAQKQTEVK